MNRKNILKILFTFMFLQFLVSISVGQQIYFVENQSAKIQKSDIDGTNLSQLLTSSVGLYGSAVDNTNSKIYYTNVVTDEIIIANINGASPTILLNGTNGIDGPRGIAVDETNSKIYWAEVGSGKIKSADLDGSNITEVIIGLSAPVDVSLDLVNNKLYWSDNGVGQKKISRSDLAGTIVTIEDIITSLDQVGGIEVDASSSKLYWVDFGATDKVVRANTDGTSIEIINTITSGSPRGISIDKDNNKVIWSDVIKNNITSANRDGTVEVEILSSLNYPLGISGNPAIATPVELVAFNATVNNSTVILNWTTATEVNNYGFEIERASISSKKRNYSATEIAIMWEEIGFVDGHGNSSSINNYTYIDNDVLLGNIQYRLKQIDTDGSFEYSDILKVISNNSLEYKLLQNSPNPFNPSTLISFSIQKAGFVKVSIYNLLGEVVTELVSEELEKGFYKYQWNAFNFSSGIYFYSISVNGFTEVKKMNLVK